MIAFVVAVADRLAFEAVAAPAIERVREPDSIVWPCRRRAAAAARSTRRSTSWPSIRISRRR